MPEFIPNGLLHGILELGFLAIALLWVGHIARVINNYHNTTADRKFTKKFKVRPSRDGKTNTKEMIYAVRRTIMHERQKLSGIASRLVELSGCLDYEAQKERAKLHREEVKVIKKLQNLFKIAQKCLGKNALAGMVADLRLEDLLADPRPDQKPRIWMTLLRPVVSRRKA